MHIHDIRDIQDTYDHIYLAPHLDDAVLSCGGAIARHTANGARVLVVALCTGAPPSEAGLSSFAEGQHASWNLAADAAVSARLDEELQALERLDADSAWAGFLDAIYRMPGRYTSDEFLFGEVAADDPLRAQVAELFTLLRERAPGATLYAPLGVGRHVDHQVVCDEALRGGPLSIAFYEDLPYAAQENTVEARLRELGEGFVPSILSIDATLARKLGAVACYTSQVVHLFGSEEQMRQLLTDYAEKLRPEHSTYGERLWIHRG